MAGQMKPPLEKHFQKQALQWLIQVKRCFVWRQNQGGMKTEKSFVRFTRGVTGISDIIGMTEDGRFLAVECKRIGKKATQQQQYFLDEVRARGGIAICADSIESLEGQFNEQDRD